MPSGQALTPASWPTTRKRSDATKQGYFESGRRNKGFAFSGSRSHSQKNYFFCGSLDDQDEKRHKTPSTTREKKPSKCDGPPAITTAFALFAPPVSGEEQKLNVGQRNLHSSRLSCLMFVPSVIGETPTEGRAAVPNADASDLPYSTTSLSFRRRPIPSNLTGPVAIPQQK